MSNQKREEEIFKLEFHVEMIDIDLCTGFAWKYFETLFFFSKSKIKEKFQAIHLFSCVLFIAASSTFDMKKNW